MLILSQHAKHTCVFEEQDVENESTYATVVVSGGMNVDELVTVLRCKYLRVDMANLFCCECLRRELCDEGAHLARDVLRGCECRKASAHVCGAVHAAVDLVAVGSRVDLVGQDLMGFNYQLL